VGEPEDPVAAALAELDGPSFGGGRPPDGPAIASVPRDRRGGGAAGVIGALVASGERVLVVCADARARRRHLTGRLGGFALCSWTALERAPELAAAAAHVVALDPPDDPALVRLAAAGGATVHLAWGQAETAFALAVAERTCALREPAAALYRGLRDGPGLAGALAAVGHPVTAGRALRVLVELGLVDVDRTAGTAVLAAAPRTDLARSATFRAAAARLERARAALGAGVQVRAAA
jgi:single-stranded-DNA-specific exonuclease